jgi:hypothetical protein
MTAQLISVAVLLLVGVRLASAARLATTRQGFRTVRFIVDGIGWRHVWPAPLVLLGVASLATILIQIPVLDWGWWTSLGGQGNPVTGTTDATVGSVWEWLVPLVFVVMLTPALPLFALAEERLFRRGAEGWSRAKRAARTLMFGLVHALIGIPLGVALALVVAGWYFMHVYLRAWKRTASPQDALLESTRAHLVYNATIVLLVLVYAVTLAME